MVDPNENAGCRVRLQISYDGTLFHGWSKQPSHRSVQGEIERCLAIIFAKLEPAPALTVAGRTDAGVHALAQIAHFDLTAEQLDFVQSRKFRGGIPGVAEKINGIAGLDSDFLVTKSDLAPNGFDARFSAIWRKYQYRIADKCAKKNPLEWLSTLNYPRTLNLDEMNSASNQLVGLHDWSAFCKARDEATNIRELKKFSWERDAENVLIATVLADAFCHSMVRALVGAIVAVGEGKLSPADLLRIRDEKVRTSEFKVMPAKGLTLVEVGYPGEAELAEQAVKARAKREL